MTEPLTGERIDHYRGKILEAMRAAEREFASTAAHIAECAIAATRDRGAAQAEHMGRLHAAMAKQRKPILMPGKILMPGD